MHDQPGQGNLFGLICFNAFDYCPSKNIPVQIPIHRKLKIQPLLYPLPSVHSDQQNNIGCNCPSKNGNHILHIKCPLAEKALG